MVTRLSVPRRLMKRHADVNLRFLTARWENLSLLTYVVPREVLTPYLPPGLSLDTRDGQAFASLVAFDFLDTRVLGVPWPGFQNFPEVNLRFYVRQGQDRGVVFIRELVPQRFVAWMARTLYNEPYRATPMHNTRNETADHLTMTYRFDWEGRAQTLCVVGAKPTTLSSPDSTAHFFKEHEWGFGTTQSGQTIRYRVTHPIWQTYPVTSYDLALDWAHVYGPDWAFLQHAEPYSVVLAAGSPIAVFGKEVEGRR